MTVTTTRRPLPWELVGHNLDGARNIDDVLRMSRLDYTVEKQPMFFPNGSQVPDFQAVVNPETSTFFGVVGEGYEPYQNREAFQFVDSISPDLTYIKAGQTHRGLIWVIAKLPETSRILDDDYELYIILQNGHSGNSSLRATICPLRVVCQNQFTASFQNSPNTISLKHTKSLPQRLVLAQSVLTASVRHVDEMNHLAESLVQKTMTSAQITDTVVHLFPIDDNASTRKVEKEIEKRKRFLNLVDADDNQNFKHTAWGLVNAWADYWTHERAFRDNENGRENLFTNSIFDVAPMHRILSLVA